MNVLTSVNTVRLLETKFMRLKTPVTIGSRFGDWQVCWLGGWTRHKLSYIVMAVRLPGSKNYEQRSPTTAQTGRGVAAADNATRKDVAGRRRRNGDLIT